MDAGCQGPATEAPPGRELLGVQPAGPPRREVGPASAAVTARTRGRGPRSVRSLTQGAALQPPSPTRCFPPPGPGDGGGSGRPLGGPRARARVRCPARRREAGPAADAAPVTAPSSGRARPASCRGRTSRDQPEHRVRHSRARESPDLGAGPRGPGWLPASRGAGADAPRHTRPPRAAGSLRQPGRGGRGQGGGWGQALTGTRGPKSREPRWSLSPRLISLAVFPLRLSERPRRPLRKGRAGVGDAWGRARLARPPSAPAAWALGRGPRGRGSRGTASRAAPPAAAARYN